MMMIWDSTLTPCLRPNPAHLHPTSITCTHACLHNTACTHTQDAAPLLISPGRGSRACEPGLPNICRPGSAARRSQQGQPGIAAAGMRPAGLTALPLAAWCRGQWLAAAGVCSMLMAGALLVTVGLGRRWFRLCCEAFFTQPPLKERCSHTTLSIPSSCGCSVYWPPPRLACWVLSGEGVPPWGACANACVCD